MPRKRKPAAKAAAIEVDSAVHTTETNISANDTRGNDAVEQQAEESEKGAVISIDGRCAWKLPQIIEIGNIHEIYNQLAALMAQNTPVVALDVEDIVVVDTAAVQLLASFVRSLAARGARVEWENLSVPLYQAAETLDMQEALTL
jgi:ABC-type transporter Mla MlaB component